MNKAPHIVSTRILTSTRMDVLKAKGWKFTSHDFISKVINIPTDLNTQAICRHVVLTSITGVKAFLQIVKELQLSSSSYTVYCISRGTNEYALASGLNIKSTAPHASALAEEIIKDTDVKEITHISSNLRRDELSEKLKRAGIAVQDVVSYSTEFTPVSIDPAYDAIVFFSPSAVDSFLSLNPLQPVACFCIGQTTADYARGKGYSHTFIPDAPSEDILLQTIVNHYSKAASHVKE
jgi:uroporphyrinogen-III synthase